MAYVLLGFGCAVIPLCVTLWALGIVCSAQGSAASQFCYSLDLNTTPEYTNLSMAYGSSFDEAGWGY